jgi:hypothetical protein
VLRSLITQIELRPGAAGGGLHVILRGDLATILVQSAPASKSKLPDAGATGSSLSVVAGIGFEPMTFRL